MTITKKQREILDAIVFLRGKGESPTVREIAQLVGLSAPATVHKHLKSLQEAGLIEKTGKSRGIRLLGSEGVPIVGRIAAGEPIENEEPDRGDPDPSMPRYLDFPRLQLDPALFAPGVSPGDLVALEVRGDSMVEAGVLDGDYVIVRRQPTVEVGQIAAVTIDGAGTLKRWSVSRAGDGGSARSVRLSPANERFEPIVIEESDGRDVRVFGRYLGLIRGEGLRLE